MKLEHEDVIATYKFPNKSMFNTFSQFTKVRRREGFDELLKLLITINPLPKNVSEFLELEEHLNFVENSIRPLNEAMIALNDDDASSTHKDDNDTVDSSGRWGSGIGQSKEKLTDESAMILTPSDETLVNIQMKGKITTIFIQVSIIVSILYMGCVYFKTIRINESTIVRVVLTCVTLILTFTFIKGRHKKRSIESEIIKLRAKRGVNLNASNESEDGTA